MEEIGLRDCSSCLRVCPAFEQAACCCEKLLTRKERSYGLPARSKGGKFRNKGTFICNVTASYRFMYRRAPKIVVILLAFALALVSQRCAALISST